MPSPFYPEHTVIIPNLANHCITVSSSSSIAISTAFLAVFEFIEDSGVFRFDVECGLSEDEKFQTNFYVTFIKIRTNMS